MKTQIYLKAGQERSANVKGVPQRANGMYILLGIIYFTPYTGISFFVILKNSWFSPEGRKFRSRNELRQYLEKHNLDYNAEDFDFSIWGRGNRPPSKSSSSNNNSASSPVASGSPSSSAASPASNADGRCITLQNTRTFWHSCSIKGSRTIKTRTYYLCSR